MTELSIVIPVYGCRSCLAALHSRLSATLAALTAQYEIVFVDDCSPDGAWPELLELCRRDTRVRAYRFSRNFGQHAAITAGLEKCRGNWAVVMDCDLQDPPEEIPRLLQAAQGGLEVVFARRKRRGHSALRRIAARAYFLALNWFNRANADGEYGAFSIISRNVINAFLAVRDRDRHYLLILFWLGFRNGEIEYEQSARHSGASAYTFGSLLKHALEGMFFQTTTLLRYIVYLGFAVSAAGAALACYYLYMYFSRSPLPGWTSLAVLILFIGGFIIMSTGITGLYVGKIFEQVKGRPLYVIDAAANDTE
jgi:glycosyltransferase involved in cell wall biosynthesis